MATPHLIARTKKTLSSLKEKVSALRHTSPTEAEVPLPEVSPAPTAQTVTINLSIKSLLKGFFAVVAIVAGLYFIMSISDIILILFIAWFLAIAIDPVIDHLYRRWHCPRALGLTLFYIFFFVIIGAIISLLIPLIAEQVLTLAVSIKDTIANLLTEEGIKKLPFSDTYAPALRNFINSIDPDTISSYLASNLLNIGSQLNQLASNGISTVITLFNGLFNFVFVLVITFFLVLQKESINNYLATLLPQKYDTYISHKYHLIEQKVSSWFRGQLILCLWIGVMTYLGLWIMSFLGVDIKYKETLAIIAGITEFIPYIGPFIAGGIAALIAANVSIWAVIWILVLFFAIQQFEGNIIVPIVMNHVVGLNPVVIMIVMLIGSKFLGVLGIILSVPITTCVNIFVDEYRHWNSHRQPSTTP